MAGELTSFNAVLSYCTTENGSYTDVTKARLIKPADWMKGTVNARTLTSQYPEKLPGHIDYDETLKFEIYLIKAQIATFSTIFKVAPGTANYWWKITFQQLTAEVTAASYLKGQGFLKKIGWSQMEEADNNAVIVPCEIEQSGEWTFNSGS